VAHQLEEAAETLAGAQARVHLGIVDALLEGHGAATATKVPPENARPSTRLPSMVLASGTTPHVAPPAALPALVATLSHMADRVSCIDVLKQFRPYLLDLGVSKGCRSLPVDVSGRLLGYRTDSGTLGLLGWSSFRRLGETSHVFHGGQSVFSPDGRWVVSTKTKRRFHRLGARDSR